MSTEKGQSKLPPLSACFNIKLSKMTLKQMGGSNDVPIPSGLDTLSN